MATHNIIIDNTIDNTIEADTKNKNELQINSLEIIPDNQHKKRGRKPKSKELINNTNEGDNLDNTNSSYVKSELIEATDEQIKTSIEINPESNNNTEPEKNYNMDNDINDDGSMKTKRRGRKPKDKFKYESTDIDEYQKNNRKEDNVIIKLPLSCLKLNEEFNVGKDLFPYNPNLSTPKPYNPEKFYTKGNIGFSLINENQNLDNEPYSDENEYVNGTDNDITKNGVNIYPTPNQNPNYNQTMIIKNKYCDKCVNCDCNKNTSSSSNKLFNDNKQSDARQIDIILNNKYNSNTDKFNVLTHLGTSLTGYKWIEKTDVACLWCCHQFKTTPWGIPFKFFQDKFQLFGNFCTPNCALAYILQNYKDDDYLWEKVALLNLLFFKVCGQYKNLMPALDKMALKMFGGTLEIDEYRNIITENEKSYSIEFPPCNTIIPMLEEIYKKTNLNNMFIPVDKTRIQVANNELKLKRSKPVVNHKNTLDFCLGKV